MAFLDSLRRRSKPSLFSGGDGCSKETAVVINATSTRVGVPAEYAYVASKHGPEHIAWTLDYQALMEDGDKHYDLLNVKLSTGEEKAYYFDITQFFGRF